MGARYDKVEPHIGIVRAPLAAALTVDANGEFGPKAFSIDANGRAVLGTAAQSGLVGVVVKNVPVRPAGIGGTAAALTTGMFMGVAAGDIVDIMIQGQIVDTGLAAGSKIYAHADGSIDAVATAGTQIGFTVEAGRLIVNLAV